MVPEKSFFAEVDFAVVSAVFACILLLTTLYFMKRFLLASSSSKELKDKLAQTQGDLLSTQRSLEEMKKEHNRKYDPYSSQQTKSVFLCLDKNGVIMSANDYAFEFFGYDPEELVGKNMVGTLLAPKDSTGRNMTNLIDRIIHNPRLYIDNENENVCKSGKRVWVSWTNRIMYDEAGEPSEIRAVGFDITPRKRLEEELRQMTVIDPVTGVLNRQKFLEDGNRELLRKAMIDYGILTGSRSI